jgi:hypothetical protein
VIHFQGQEVEQGELGCHWFLELGKGSKKLSQQEVSYKVHPYIWLQSQLG